MAISVFIYFKVINNLQMAVITIETKFINYEMFIINLPSLSKQLQLPININQI